MWQVTSMYNSRLDSIMEEDIVMKNIIWTINAIRIWTTD